MPKIEINIELKDISKAFWSMDCVDQADFLNALAQDYCEINEHERGDDRLIKIINAYCLKADTVRFIKKLAVMIGRGE